MAFGTESKLTLEDQIAQEYEIIEYPNSVPSLANGASLLAEPAPVLFIDLDNTLYPSSSGIMGLMIERIVLYCVEKLGMERGEAERLSRKYFSDYGLAVRGLLIDHQVDPVDYDEFVDGGLPLDDVLRVDAQLQGIFMEDERIRGLDKWVFTNAGIKHARRVLRLLGLSEALFRGIVYCDYSEANFHCKPEEASYIRAMKVAGVRDSRCAVLVDDSEINVAAAVRMGWKAIHVVEQAREGESTSPAKAKYEPIKMKGYLGLTDVLSLPTISTIHQLPDVLERMKLI